MHQPADGRQKNLRIRGDIWRTPHDGRCGRRGGSDVRPYPDGKRKSKPCCHASPARSCSYRQSIPPSKSMANALMIWRGQGRKWCLQPRPVTIHELAFLGFTDAGTAQLSRNCIQRHLYPQLRPRYCASGGLGGLYLAPYIVSAVGPFTDAHAISLDFLAESVHNATRHRGNPRG